MKMNFRLRTVLLHAAAVLCAATVSAQQDYYRFPMDVPPLLSANFAEMRINHFHSGIDIKTGGTVGHNVYAVADGYISRITVAPGGYGRALYIAHPNGTTSVYGHLQSFSPEVESYLRGQRYQQKKSNINLFCTPEQFPVKKGQVVAQSGNSGYSLGPHLHFEIRRSADGRTLNTLSRGIVQVRDDIPPMIAGLYYVRVDTLSGIPVHGRPRRVQLVQSQDGYSVASEVEVGRCGYFIVETTDRKNDVTNTFGVYRVVMSLDGTPAVVFEKDEFLFSNTRYCNACVNYPAQRGSRNEHIMLALQSNNLNPMYKTVVERGTVRVAEGQRRDVGIVVEDDCGNAVSLSFAVRGVKQEPVKQPKGERVFCDSRFSRTLGELAVTIPAGVLYQPLFFVCQQEQMRVQPRSDSIRPLSGIYRVGDASVPLHKSISVAIAASLPESLTSRARLAAVSDKGTLSSAGGKWRSGVVEAQLSSFGRYCVVVDTVAPVATASFADGEDLSGRPSVTFTMRDNFSGIADFECTVDGQWAILEQNVLRGQVTLYFDAERMSPGREHTLTFTLTDGAGNRSTLRRSFLR